MRRNGNEQLKSLIQRYHKNKQKVVTSNTDNRIIFRLTSTQIVDQHLKNYLTKYGERNILEKFPYKKFVMEKNEFLLSPKRFLYKLAEFLTNYRSRVVH